MNTMIKIIPLFASFLLSACYSVQYMTSPNYATEADLVADAYQNGLMMNINLPYRQAYQNLKQAYQQCVSFTTEKDLVYSDNRFEESLEMGTILIKVYPQKFLQKTLVESLGPNQTRITLFLPRQYPHAHARFRRDILRALGQDPECNKGEVTPVRDMIPSS